MADPIIGRNVNTHDEAVTTIISLNSTTAVTLKVANSSRIQFSVALAPGSFDVDVYIRYYAATTDNIKKGYVLTRRLLGNDNLFYPVHCTTPDNIYTGEISAIVESGTTDVFVTEY